MVIVLLTVNARGSEIPLPDATHCGLTATLGSGRGRAGCHCSCGDEGPWPHELGGSWAGSPALRGPAVSLHKGVTIIHSPLCSRAQGFGLVNLSTRFSEQCGRQPEPRKWLRGNGAKGRKDLARGSEQAWLSHPDSARKAPGRQPGRPQRAGAGWGWGWILAWPPGLLLQDTPGD